MDHRSRAVPLASCLFVANVPRRSHHSVPGTLRQISVAHPSERTVWGEADRPHESRRLGAAGCQGAPANLALSGCLAGGLAASHGWPKKSQDKSSYRLMPSAWALARTLLLTAGVARRLASFGSRWADISLKHRSPCNAMARVARLAGLSAPLAPWSRSTGGIRSGKTNGL